MESRYQNLLYEQRGAVTLITIDRPERMNAIDGVTHRELVDAWDRFRADDDAYVAVLTGAGDKAFCAGGDLKAAFAGEEPPIDVRPEELAAHARGERPGILGPSRWTDVYKPTIAAINGVAYAGGLEWACWTDLAVADEHATFGVTCRRWNIGLADGGTQRLPRIVGFRRAMDLIITGRVIDAREAQETGWSTRSSSAAPASSARSSWPSGSRRCPSRRFAPTRRPRSAASAARSTRACASRPSASTACSTSPRSRRACAGSTSATTRTGFRTASRRRRGCGAASRCRRRA